MRIFIDAGPLREGIGTRRSNSMARSGAARRDPPRLAPDVSIICSPMVNPD